MTGYVRAALPDTEAALPTERNSHAAVAIDSDLLIVGGESNAEMVHEMCIIDTEKQVNYLEHAASMMGSCFALTPVFRQRQCHLHVSCKPSPCCKLGVESTSELHMFTG